MSWYHAHPEYAALWPMLEQLDMEELQRQYDILQEQNAVLQQMIDQQNETIRQLREQRDCNARYMSFDTSHTSDQL